MIRTLILHVAYPSRASYFEDWLNAFQVHPQLTVTTLNLFIKDNIETLKTTINQFELIVLLHSCTGDSLLYINPIKNILLDRKCPLISFVGNELNIPHIKLSDKIQFLKKIEANFIASQLLQETAEWLYSDCTTKTVSIPHALNPIIFKTVRPYHTRPIKFGTRSFPYPPFLGDNERNRLLEYFQKKIQDTDISFEDRLTRNKWANFLNNCKATVSTEAGSWYLEKDDSTVSAIGSYLKQSQKTCIIKPNDSFKRFINSLPYSMKNLLGKMMKKMSISYQSASFSNVDFEKIYDLFFKDKQCPVYGKCISSRHFDAIGTSTIQVMFPGRFNDILIADEHYIVLNKDFSNIKDVLDKVDDPNFCNNMTQQGMNLILEKHTYKHRVDTLLHYLC